MTTVYTWSQAQANNLSPLAIGKTPARRARKQARSKENVALRAALHRDRIRNSGVQVHIDQISRRK